MFSISNFFFCALLAAIVIATPPHTDAGADKSRTAPTPAPVLTGADNLVHQNFAPLRGKRVGLITNQTSRVAGTHLADLLHRSRDVELAAIFAPEHGFRGDVEAGAHVKDNHDAKTGAVVYSLHGKTKSPTPAMLNNIDTLVFDIQDAGVRFYTYASTMGLAMQAAARNNKRFVVLDRPNALGGTYVSGFIAEPAHFSFVGMYPIPVAHGLTLGELAQMIKGEAMLHGLENLDLQVIPMTGWHRDMALPATALPWTKPSPNIVDFETMHVYPGTAFLEGTYVSEGRGTRRPFTQIGAPWVDANALSNDLQDRALPGVKFAPIHFTPRRIAGMAENPKHKAKRVGGVRVEVTDPVNYQPVETGIHILAALQTQAQSKRRRLFKSSNFIELLAGTKRLRKAISAKTPAADIIASWADEIAAFKRARARYLLY